jgi:hypothetical protein
MGNIITTIGKSGLDDLYEKTIEEIVDILWKVTQANAHILMSKSADDEQRKFGICWNNRISLSVLNNEKLIYALLQEKRSVEVIVRKFAELYNISIDLSLATTDSQKAIVVSTVKYMIPESDKILS